VFNINSKSKKKGNETRHLSFVNKKEKEKENSCSFLNSILLAKNNLFTVLENLEQ